MMKFFSKIIFAGLLVLLALSSNAQGINFQGVARSANGTIIASSNISLRLSIISKNVDATPEYVETKTVVTNAQGIFTVVVGDATNATVVGSFKTINWAESPKFLKVEMDPSAGTNYINMGATQLQYVPYSYYSLGVAAENISGVLPVTKGGTGVGTLADLKTALSVNTDKYSNLFVGQNAGLNYQDPNNYGYGTNTAVGSNALQNNTDYWNVAVGGNALATGKWSRQNTAVGYNSMSGYKKGFDNVAIGYAALSGLDTGIYNTALGTQTLINLKNSNNNTALGYRAMAALKTGTNNLAVGYQAGYALDSGSNNIFIGTNAGGADVHTKISNKLIIANSATSTPLIYGDFDTRKLTINGDLNVTGKINSNLGISTSDSTIKLLNKRIDSLVAVLSSRSLTRIDSSNLSSSNPVIATRFLDSTFLPTINFNGSSTYVQIGSSGLLGSRIYGNNFTVEAWIKSYKVSDTNQYIYSSGYQWNGNVGTFKLALYRGRITAQVGNFSGYNISAAFPNDSSWHHVVFTHYNFSRAGVIYIDGIEKSRMSNTGTLNMVNGSIGVEGIGANLDIGNEPPREFYKGHIRKLRVSKGNVYNANFTPSYTYVKSDSTYAFYELNEGTGTRIKASDSAYNGTLYNGTWSILDTISNVRLNDSLVAYYAFSGNAIDSSANGLNGTVVGANLASDRFGRANNAYSFNTNQYINIPNSATYNTYPFSVSLWVSLDSLNNSGGNLFKKYSSGMWNGFNLTPSTGATDSSGFIYPFYLTGDGVPNGLIGGYGIPESKFVINNIPTRRWVHIAMTVDHTGGRLYMNGNLIDTLDWRTVAKACSNSLNWVIGGSYDANAWFKGKIDEVRVYKRALNLNEVRYLSSH